MVWSKVPRSQSCEVALLGKSKGLQSESEIDPLRLKHLNVWSQAVTLWGKWGPAPAKGFLGGEPSPFLSGLCFLMKSLMVTELLAPTPSNNEPKKVPCIWSFQELFHSHKNNQQSKIYPLPLLRTPSSPSPTINSRLLAGASSALYSTGRGCYLEQILDKQEGVGRWSMSDRTQPILLLPCLFYSKMPLQ